MRGVTGEIAGMQVWAVQAGYALARGSSRAGALLHTPAGLAVVVQQPVVELHTPHDRQLTPAPQHVARCRRVGGGVTRRWRRRPCACVCQEAE